MSIRHTSCRFQNTVANILPSAPKKACGPLPAKAPGRWGRACTTAYKANTGGTFLNFLSLTRPAKPEHPCTNVALCTWAFAKSPRLEMARVLP
jgi:hypothetical protein